jgi:hypothetical protein
MFIASKNCIRDIDLIGHFTSQILRGTPTSKKLVSKDENVRKEKINLEENGVFERIRIIKNDQGNRSAITDRNNKLGLTVLPYSEKCSY